VANYVAFNITFHCSRLTTVQGIQDYASLIFWHTVYNRYDRIPACDRQTDGQTDRQTPHDGIGRAYT